MRGQVVENDQIAAARPCAGLPGHRRRSYDGLFGGSGSTLIAAEQTGRRGFLMEIDPLYCDVIVERWQRFTGRKAERSTG
jgi:hypothetical protein